MHTYTLPLNQLLKADTPSFNLTHCCYATPWERCVPAAAPRALRPGGTRLTLMCGDRRVRDRVRGPRRPHTQPLHTHRAWSDTHSLRSAVRTPHSVRAARTQLAGIRWGGQPALVELRAARRASLTLYRYRGRSKANAKRRTHTGDSSPTAPGRAPAGHACTASMLTEPHASPIE